MGGRAIYMDRDRVKEVDEMFRELKGKRK